MRCFTVILNAQEDIVGVRGDIGRKKWEMGNAMAGTGGYVIFIHAILALVLRDTKGIFWKL